MAPSKTTSLLKKSDVADATHIPLHTLQHWLDRRLIQLSGADQVSQGTGNPRRFTRRRIDQIAIAHRITKLGIPANTAVSLAAKFTEESQCGRPIGGLFPVGRTVLIASHDGTSCIVNIPPDSDLDAILTTTASLVIDVGQIIHETNERMKEKI